MKNSIRLKNADFARVIEFDALSRKDRRTRRYHYLVPARNGGVKIFTVAVRRTRDGMPAAKIIATHDPRRKQIWLRDVDYYGMCGWTVDWNIAPGSSQGTIPWSFRCGAAFPFDPVVNPEVLDETKYARCGWDASKIGLADYLHLFELDPRVEYVAKSGLWTLVNPAGIRRLLRDREFFTFCRAHTAEIKSGNYGVRDVIFAAKHGVSLERAAEHFDALRIFAAGGGLPAAARKRAVQLAAWLKRAYDAYGITQHEYVRFLRYAERLGWDLMSDAVLPPPARFREILERVEEEADKLDERLASRAYRTGMRRARERYGDIAEMTSGALSAVLPFAKSEFRREGRAMKNCVGNVGYDSRVARGESLVVFIRRNGTPDADMEICLSKLPRISQLYAAENRKPAADVEAFAKKILRRVRKASAVTQP